jgi:hemerythrin-like domain-containing protein
MPHVAGIAPPGSLGPGFEEPFGMLHACHERVERMLALLQKLRSHMRESGADEQVRQATRDIMRYFDKAAPQHHLDEELHVFPVLVGTQDEGLVRLVARLQRDHQQMSAQWVAVRSLLEEVESGQRTRFNDADDAVLDAFANLYADHLQAEEESAYPHASAGIGAERLKAMSADMMARRGVTAPR